MSDFVIKLPPVPTQADYPNEYRFMDALRVWEKTCRAVLARSTNVEPPAVPRQDQYPNEYRFMDALNAYQRVFEEAAKKLG